MKRIIVAAIVALVALCPAIAQNLNFKTSEPGASSQSGFSSWWISYSPVKSYAKNVTSDSFNKFSLGFENATALPVDSFSAFITKGMVIDWFTKKQNSVKTNIVAIKVPVNLMLELKVTDRLSLMPFAGLNGSFGIIGRSSLDDVHINVYSEDDMGDYKLRRFLFGWQLGTRLDFVNSFAFVSFEKSFNDEGKYIASKRGGFNFGIGRYF